MITVLVASVALAAPQSERIQSIEDVVTEEGYIPTSSQSNIYRPGAVLVPNDRGGHDMVVESCIGAEPVISAMSQSNIATSLSAGVSARFTVVRGSVGTDIERRMSFIDPEQRTIPLGQMIPTENCVNQVNTASALMPVESAFVVQEVLVAQIKNTICTKSDASGRIIGLGAAEAATYSECAQESDGQVPIGYKKLDLSSVLRQKSQTRSLKETQSGSNGISFNMPSLNVELMLKQQACSEQAKLTAKITRDRKMGVLIEETQHRASQSWSIIEPQAIKCVEVKDPSFRSSCIQAVYDWLAQATVMRLTLPASVEHVETECGKIDIAFPASEKNITSPHVERAKSLRAMLTAPPSTTPPAAYRTGQEAWSVRPSLQSNYSSYSSSGAREKAIKKRNTRVTVGITLVVSGAVSGVIGLQLYTQATNYISNATSSWAEENNVAMCRSDLWGDQPCKYGIEMQHKRLLGIGLGLTGGTITVTGAGLLVASISQ